MVEDTMILSQEYAKKIHVIMDDEDDEHKFTQVVQSFKSKQMLESTAITKLTGMMRCKFDELTLGLNNYLSEGFKIEKSEDGQLFYRSPTQEDLVPLLMDVRMQQVAAELGEAKSLLQQARKEQKSTKDTIRKQNITVHDLKCALKEERKKNKENRLRLQQESRLALEQEQQKNEDEIRRFHQETLRIQEEEIQKVKDDFGRFRELTEMREAQLKQYIRQLEADSKEGQNLKVSSDDLEAEMHQHLREQIDENLAPHSSSTSPQQSQTVFEMLFESRTDLQLKNDEMKATLEKCTEEKNRLEILTEKQAGLQGENEEMKAALEKCTGAKNRLASKIRKKVQSFISSTECPICFEPMKNTHISPECLHRFCGVCFKESIWKCNNECPMCRIHLSSKRCLRRDEDYDTLVDAFRDIESTILEEDDEGDNNGCSEGTLSSSVARRPKDGDNESAMEVDDQIGEVEDDMKGVQTKRQKTNMRSRASFDQRMDQLREFKASHGHVNIRNGSSLGRWCYKVRKSYWFGREGKTIKTGLVLTEDDIRSLRQIGFVFDYQKGAASEDAEDSMEGENMTQDHDDEYMESDDDLSVDGDDTIRSCNVLTTIRGAAEDKDRGRKKRKNPGLERSLPKFSIDAFNNKLKDLEKFKARHGHLNVAWGLDSVLSEWCRKVRKSFESKAQGKKMDVRLTEERIRLLREIGFDFNGKQVSLENPNTKFSDDYSSSEDEMDEEDLVHGRPKFRKSAIKAFNDKIERLENFKTEHGHMNVTSDMDRPLWNWCQHIRRSFERKAQGKKMDLVLTEERIKSLEEIGFNFDREQVALVKPTKSSHAEYSRSSRRQMREEKKNRMFGDDNSSSRDEIDEKDLTDERPIFKVSAIKAFNDNIKRLENFKTEHGHLNVTSDMDKSLYHWCRNVKTSFERKKHGLRMPIVLTEERIKSLEEIGFDFNGKQVSLENPTTKFGDDYSSSEDEMDEEDLSDERPKFRKSAIKAFNDNLKRLENFKTEHGHMNVTLDMDKTLWNWCRNIRRSFKLKAQGKKMDIILTEERIKSLEEIGLNFDREQVALAKPTKPSHAEYSRSSRSQMREEKKNMSGKAMADQGSSLPTHCVNTFNDHLKRLENFKTKHGHLNVTSDMDKSLRNWCQNIRASYRMKFEGKRMPILLTEERINVLYSVGFNFDPLKANNINAISGGENMGRTRNNMKEFAAAGNGEDSSSGEINTAEAENKTEEKATAGIDKDSYDKKVNMGQDKDEETKRRDTAVDIEESIDNGENIDKAKNETEESDLTDNDEGSGSSEVYIGQTQNKETKVSAAAGNDKDSGDCSVNKKEADDERAKMPPADIRRDSSTEGVNMSEAKNEEYKGRAATGKEMDSSGIEINMGEAENEEIRESAMAGDGANSSTGGVNIGEAENETEERAVAGNDKDYGNSEVNMGEAKNEEKTESAMTGKDENSSGSEVYIGEAKNEETNESVMAGNGKESSSGGPNTGETENDTKERAAAGNDSDSSSEEVNMGEAEKGQRERAMASNDKDYSNGEVKNKGEAKNEDTKESAMTDNVKDSSSGIDIHMGEANQETKKKATSTFATFLTKDSMDSFNQRLKQLKQYKAIHGHLNVSRRKDRSLHNWCGKIRKSFLWQNQEGGMSTPLVEKRVSILRDMGFIFGKEQHDQGSSLSKLSLQSSDQKLEIGVRTNQSLSQKTDEESSNEDTGIRISPENDTQEGNSTEGSRRGKRQLHQDQILENNKRLKK